MDSIIHCRDCEHMRLNDEYRCTELPGYVLRVIRWYNDDGKVTNEPIAPDRCPLRHSPPTAEGEAWWESEQAYKRAISRRGGGTKAKGRRWDKVKKRWLWGYET